MPPAVPSPPASPLERALAAAWEEVLGISPIGRDDRFAELGGTSIGAERVLALLRRRVAVEIGAETLVGAPTLAQIASRIEAAQRRRFGAGSRGTGTGAGARGGGSLRVLAAPERETLAPVHCIAGAGAGVVSFLGLASLAGEQRRVIAHQAHGLASRALPSWSLAAHARRHERELRRAQPHGPYLLIGHSFGGHVAVAVAARLARRGEEVRRVILLDTVLRGAGGESVAAYRSPESAPARPSRGARLRTHARVLLAGLVRLEPIAHQEAFWERGIRVQNRVRPRPLPAYACVLVTDENAGQAALWRDGLAAPARVLRIPGTHLSVLSDPEILERVLEELDLPDPSHPEESP